MKARATSAGDAPCAPTPGKSITARGSMTPSLCDGARVRSTHYGTDAREPVLPHSVLPPLINETRNMVP